MMVETLILWLKTDKPFIHPASMLRGFIARRVSENPLLYQHDEMGKVIYAYPRVQYKVINKTPLILGIEEGVGTLLGLSAKIDQLHVGNTIYEVREKQITEKFHDFGCTDEIIKYAFVSPWLALSQENHLRYVRSNRRERLNILRRILVGNILSVAKSLGYVVEDQLSLHTRLRQVSTTFKGMKMDAFLGTFEVNFDLPDLVGIGKSVSRGFGTVRRMS